MFLLACVILFTGEVSVSVLGGVSVQGVSVQGGLSGRPSLYGKERSVRILLECILVVMLIFICRRTIYSNQIWCYTTDRGTHWQPCDIPLCGIHLQRITLSLIDRV